jgi:hypothetical protein
MKRISFFCLAGAMLAGLVTVSAAQSEPLGDYARAARKESKPTATKKFDNDNLPKSEKLSVVGAASEDPAQAAALGAAPSDQQAQTTQTPSDGANKQQPAEDWKGKIDAQKSKMDLLSRELDVAQREYRLRAAAMYADAGNRLRSAGSWDKEDADYKKQIAQRQQALDDAKKGLDDLQEQARKAGVSAKDRQ